MWYPAHVDGCSLVIIRRTSFGYGVVASGCLSFDGEVLRLEDGRPITDAELEAFQPVVAGNRIRECAGFDFFLMTFD